MQNVRRHALRFHDVDRRPIHGRTQHIAREGTLQGLLCLGRRDRHVARRVDVLSFRGVQTSRRASVREVSPSVTILAAHATQKQDPAVHRPGGRVRGVPVRDRPRARREEAHRDEDVLQGEHGEGGDQLLREIASARQHLVRARMLLQQSGEEALLGDDVVQTR